MDNSFFVLCAGIGGEKKTIKISRLQICTWNLLHGNTFFELGIEIAPGIIPEGQNCTIDFIAPWLMNTSKIISMHERFADNSNCRFIFNETVKSSSPIAGDNRNGTQIVFTTNTRIITILPVVHNILNNRVLQLSFVNKAPKDSSPYIRVLIEIKQKTLAAIKKGIAKCNYIFDFKINERRNLPDFVLDTINADGLIYCDIERFFCLHVVPDSCDISFIDSQKLKNIRSLELSAFGRYLASIYKIEIRDYIITFSKDEQKESYSLFSVFTQEIIGTFQIILAIITNIVCSLLFAIGSLRVIRDPNMAWYKQIPCEYWIALSCVILLTLYVIIHRNKTK